MCVNGGKPKAVLAPSDTQVNVKPYTILWKLKNGKKILTDNKANCKMAGFLCQGFSTIAIEYAIAILCVPINQLHMYRIANGLQFAKVFSVKLTGILIHQRFYYKAFYYTVATFHGK